MLLLHILIAVLSLIWATMTFAKPSAPKLKVSYSLTGAVVLSGVMLVVQNHTVLLQACTSGLFYLAASTSLTVFTHRKLATQLTN
jgi:hypothetical protein